MRTLIGDTIQAIPTGDVPATLTNVLGELAIRLIPWRTGPFDLAGFPIDSEWQSFMKWRRIETLFPWRTGLRIGDVGCSNGYFMFRALEHRPEVVVGFDPVERCWMQFCLLNGFFRRNELAFVPAGLETLTNFSRFFDLILCMGVMYHQRDPFQAMKHLFEGLAPGGSLVLESLCIPLDEPHLLVPSTRYAKMRNAWIIPSPPALVALAERAGFEEIELHRFGRLTTVEQRRTRLAPYESLEDFLDPEDPERTVEGYPAPHTAAIVAKKPG